MTKDHFITLNTGVEYIPWTELGEYEEDAQLWEEVVESWIPNAELRAYVQKSMGYTLLGDNRERLSFWLEGPTGTGKSTLLNTLMASLGDYAGPVDLSIFRGDRHTNPQLVAALPKRIITASEASQSNVLHADVFKRITGGEAISAELKYSNDMVQRVPCFTPWIATNSAPSMPGADSAVYRRMIIIPFHERLNENSKLGVQLRTSGGVKIAALSWAVEGWRMYAASDGLASQEAPGLVDGAKEEFVSDLSDIATFIGERLNRSETRIGPNETWPDTWKVTVSELFEEYEDWCIENRTPDRDRLTRKKFTTQMKSLGVEYANVRYQKEKARCFLGVQIKRLRTVRDSKNDG